MAVAVAAALVAGCSQSGASSANQQSKLSDAGKAAVAQIEAKAKIPAALSADGVSVGPATVAKKAALSGQGEEIEVSATMKNGAAAPLQGVNLMITFMDASGTVVGGHSTQQYFQPALKAGGEQPIVIRAPALGGSVNGATQAQIKIVSLAKDGGSPDGWKPLDPNNMPPPKEVPGAATEVAADGTVIKESAPAPTGAGAAPKTP